MREKKKKDRRIKKILIRVSRAEKKLAEKVASQHGENTSEFFRRLIQEEKDRGKVDVLLRIVESQQQSLKEIKGLLAHVKTKAQG